MQADEQWDGYATCMRSCAFPDFSPWAVGVGRDQGP